MTATTRPRKKLNGDSPATQHDLSLWGGELTRRIDGVDERLDAIESRLDEVETRLDKVEIRLDKIESRLDKIEATMATKEDLVQLEQKLVQHIDTALENFLTKIMRKFDDHERRITVLEQSIQQARN